MYKVEFDEGVWVGIDELLEFDLCAKTLDNLVGQGAGRVADELSTKASLDCHLASEIAEKKKHAVRHRTNARYKLLKEEERLELEMIEARMRDEHALIMARAKHKTVRRLEEIARQGQA